MASTSSYQAGCDTVGAVVWGSKSGIGTSPVQLTTTPTPVFKGVMVMLDPDTSPSTARIAVGGGNSVTLRTADTTDGTVLVPGMPVTIPVNDVSLIWVIGSTTGLRVSWLGA